MDKVYLCSGKDDLAYDEGVNGSAFYRGSPVAKVGNQLSDLVSFSII